VEQRIYCRAAAQLLANDDPRKDQKFTTLAHAGVVAASVYEPPHLARSLPPLETDLIHSLFFQYFDVEDTASGHALASCLPQTISTSENDALSVAVSSVGCVLLSKMTNSSDKLIMARQKYGTAVRLTCNILQTTVASETCLVIRVILILAIFEVSCPNSLFQNVWFEITESLIHDSYSPVQTRCARQQGQFILKGPPLYSRLGEWTYQIVF
jgi:hypothetical protein